jgi:hypothetical protein
MNLFKGLLAHIHDLHLELSRHQASLEEWKNFNAECWRFLATAAQLPTLPEPAGNVTAPVQAPPVTNGLIQPQGINPSGRKPNCSALSFSYLQFKVIEAVQPHPAYELDDGFQPLGVIQHMTFAGDRKAKRALSELCRAGFALLDIVDDLVAKGMVVKTEYEPCNGDVMVGLAANLPMREAAHVERKKLIRNIACKYRLVLQWNEDGTGSLITSSGHMVEPSGSVWALLSCLYTIRDSVANRPESLN